MMENKVKLKKYLFSTVFSVLILLIIFFILNIYEYRIYTLNFNKKISAITMTVKDKYKKITDNELMEIINSKIVDKTFFDKYGIDIDNDSIILENNTFSYIFVVLNIIFLIISIVILLFIFLRYNNDKDREINSITRYIEEINKKNYSLCIDEISEDELSILKNEVYKTTIMLKESAENSTYDKIRLKKSLEDISHQLKTPLTSIIIMLDNLIDNPNMDCNTREEFIRDIKRDITSINFLVQSILKLSKFDANTINFIKEEVLLKNIIDSSIQNVSTLCDLKNISINVYEDNSGILKCDFKWQVEAITNILKNCIEHSNDDDIIKINIESNKVYGMIVIEDFGSGISDNDLPHIFERFYKGSNQSGDSIGIGLSLAKTIIEEDNGTISVKQKKGKGTIFTIKYFL